MIKGVLFDFDGVIADTMDFNYLCWKQAFLEYGYQLGKRDYLLMEGTGAKTIAEKFIARINGKKPFWREIQKAKNDLFVAGYQLKIYSEIFTILDLLDNNNIPFAIVTGSDRMRLEKIVDPAFLQRFKGSVTMDDTVKAKPYADPYLKGAEIIGFDPSVCLVVENAPSGITAGKASGATTVALMTTLGKKDLQHADKIFTTHLDLFNWLEEELNG